MLHTILGFGGRIGRREYFFACLALRFLVSLLTLALTAAFTPHLGSAGYGERSTMSTGLMISLCVFVLPIYLWFAYAFQAKRYRDMGWNPVYVIPGNIAALTVMILLALFSPAFILLAVLFAVLQNVCLWFWPTKPTGNGDWYSSARYDGPADRRPDMGSMPATTSRRPATVRTSAPPPAFSPTPSGFGRRGL